MDIILNPNCPILLLAALTFVCGWLVIPYRMNLYNTEWLPRWIRPDIEIVDVPYPDYYPANESRTALAVSLFFAFILTAAAGCVNGADNLAVAISYLYALIPSAYLLHRYFCLHRLNRFTPIQVARHTGMLKTYRVWLILLIWLYAFSLPLAAASRWLPVPTLRLLTLPPAAAVLLFVGEEFVSLCVEYKNNYEKDVFRKCLIDTVPHNYYLLLALASTVLTQAALWTGSLVPLLLWMVLLAAFSVAEFYLRFHDSDRYTDWIESWGMDETYPLLDPDEELWFIHRKELKALRRKHRPCHLIIVGQGTNRYAVEITADLENKLREFSLRKEALLYIKTFPTVREARLNAMHTEASKERILKLMDEKNPTHENWAGRDIPFLLNLGTNEMNRTETYTVARHAFRLQMNASSPLWECLAAYEPFVGKEAGGENTATTPVFTLTVVDILPVDTSLFTSLLVRGETDSDSMGLEVHQGKAGEYLFELKMPHSSATSGKLLVSPGFRTASLLLQGTREEKVLTLHRSLMLCYLLATVDKDTLLMHASVTVNHGKGFLFMGKSGTGKSTHCSLWLKHIPGSKLMNDDHPVVRLLDGEAWVFGSPWSGKTPCYRNVSAPVGAFVRLRQAKGNHIRRQNALEGYASLLTGSSGMSWETALADGKSRTLQQLIATVPCWLLHCLPDEEAARLCAETIVARSPETERKEESCKE